jgi:hypothetical protein
MGIYQQFTSDKQQLTAAIDHLGQRWAGLGTPFSVDAPKWVAAMTGETTFHRDDRPLPNPTGFLTWAVQGLQNTPGRKAVVLFSHSFDAPPALVDLANRAGVVVYAIDPEGVDINNPIIPGNTPYRVLAKETGGLWIRSAPGADLTEDLGKVLEDMNGYYLIGYEPDRSDFELSHGSPVHHNIEVKLRRPGLTVRARNGFLGVPDPVASPPPQTREEYLHDALFSPFNAGGIRLRLDPVYGALPPDPKTKQRLPLLRAMLAIEGGDVRFVDAESGKKKLALDVVVAVYDQDGKPVASQDRTFTLDVTAEKAAQLLAQGLHATMDVKLAKPGAFQIRAAVRDVGAGKIGSAYSFVAVPDFNQPEIALSSIELSGGNATQMGWAEFAPGTVVHFDCEIFGVQTGRPPGAPKVDMEIRLFRGAGPLFDSKPLAVTTASLSEHLLTGNMKIGGDIQPGDYTMQLVAYDRLASPKRQVATQWIDLTVVNPSGAAR